MTVVAHSSWDSAKLLTTQLAPVVVVQGSSSEMNVSPAVGLKGDIGFADNDSAVPSCSFEVGVAGADCMVLGVDCMDSFDSAREDTFAQIAEGGLSPRSAVLGISAGSEVGKRRVKYEPEPAGGPGPVCEEKDRASTEAGHEGCGAAEAEDDVSLPQTLPSAPGFVTRQSSVPYDSSHGVGEEDSRRRQTRASTAGFVARQTRSAPPSTYDGSTSISLDADADQEDVGIQAQHGRSGSSSSSRPASPSSLWKRRVNDRGRCLTLNVTAPGPSLQSIMFDRQATMEGLYITGEIVGHGSTSTVIRALRRDNGTVVALKTVKSSDPEMLRFAKDEYELLRRLDHPNIIKAIAFHHFGVHDVMCLEFFDGRSLDDLLLFRRGVCLPECNARHLSRTLFDAVKYLHSVQVLHRDIGPTNVLVSKSLDDIRLIDFNAAVATDVRPGILRPDVGTETSPPLTPTGTRLFAAPEVLFGEPSSESSDVWTTGLCLHYMLTGCLPQGRGDSRTVVSHKSLQAVSCREVDLQCQALAHVSKGCVELLRRVLMLQPEARPSAAEVLQSAWYAEPGDPGGGDPV